MVCAGVLGAANSPVFAQATPGPTDAVAAEETAANPEVRRFMENFQGRGALADESQPTPPEQAVERFELAPGLRMELVASEPRVVQPLSLSFDERGRLWVVQYRQYPFPAGLKVVRYDQYLRAVFDKVPLPPPHHEPGKDCITVLEDRDADGRYETSRDVIDGLNIATSVVVGGGGMWVLNPPYLLFYPDADGDAQPDGPPVVHLSGFGLEDTHSVANSLKWGPDGWLYGANGSTTTGDVETRRGQRTSFLGQCIWRYHPKREVFEIYAEGGGNTFSLEIDGVGRVFSGTNNGDTRGMYYPQGSYGIKNWGKHGPLTNPFAFGFFEHMRFEGDGDRFAQAFSIYEGGTLPEEYRGNIIAANALHNRVWASRLYPDTSTFRTVDSPPLAVSDDRWFRPVDVEVGPDGAVYLADWYDSRLSHVDPRDNWHKSSGRIYRVQGSAAPRPEKEQGWSTALACPTHFDLTTWTTPQLIELFQHPNRFFRQTAVRVLVEREDRQSLPLLLAALAGREKWPSLHALWTLYQLQAIDDGLWKRALQHEDPDVRRWAVRLLGDDGQAGAEVLQAIVERAADEPALAVRTQLASSAKRLPAATGLAIVEKLTAYDQDLADLHQGLLVWWAMEAHCAHARPQVLALFEQPSFWGRPMVQQYLLERVIQRCVLDSAKPDWASVDRLLASAPGLEPQRALVPGLRQAVAGQTSISMPAAIQEHLARYRAAANESDLPMQIRAGDLPAIQAAVAAIGKAETAMGERLEYVELLGRGRVQAAVPGMLKLLSETKAPALQRVALQALGNFEDPKIGQTICNQLHRTLNMEPGMRDTALRVLASRSAWAHQLLKEIEESRLPAAWVPTEVLQQLRLHADESLQQRLQRIWGQTRESSAELAEKIEAVTQTVRAGGGDVHAGRELFTRKCGTCHTLFQQGGKTGPNLTGYERSNLAFMVPSIVDPSSAIREEFTQFQILTSDGRVVMGLIEQQDGRAVTLRTADNQTQLISRDQIEQLQASKLSIMPEGLLDDLAEGQLRDLFAYLTARTYLETGSGK
jgi:putative heme-binding domain-containing protein